MEPQSLRENCLGVSIEARIRLDGQPTVNFSRFLEDRQEEFRSFDRYFFHHLPGDLVFCSEGHLVDEFVDAILPEMHFLFKYFANDDRIAGSSNRSVLERIS